MSRTKSKAGIGVKALRDRLANASPRFLAASKQDAEIDQMIIGVRQRLQQARTQRKLQQQQMAVLMELTQPAISKIETGTGDIGLRTLCRYAQALGLQPVVSFVPKERPARLEARDRTAAAALMSRKNYA